MTPKPAQKHLFYSEMAKLLEAGFGIREAAGVLAEHGLPASQLALLKELHQGLDEGKTIAESLGRNPKTVSELERGIISAGERGGRLPTAMRHLADYFEMLASVRREVLRALVHPIIILHLGIFIATVPTAMLAVDRNAVGISGGFFATLLVTYAIALALFFGIRALLRAARRNAGLDRAIRRIPLVGKTRTNTAMAGFCKVYHTCLLAGIPMRETLRMAADASQSGLIRQAAGHLQKSLAEGNPLGPGMTSESAFPKAFARSYATGEAAGTLDTDLDRWAGYFQEEARAGARTLAAVLPRILYLMVLCYVGWKIVGFYDSYYGSLLKQLE